LVLRLGIATYDYLWRYDIEQTLEHIAKHGFQMIELMSTPPHAWPRDLDKKKRDHISELLKSYRLQVSALNPTYGDLNLASPRYTVRRLAIEELKEQIELARHLGSKIVVVVPGSRHLVGTPPMEKIWNYSRSGIVELAKFAEDNGIIIGLECAPFRFIERAEQLKRMIEEVGSEFVKAIFDTSNTCIVEPLQSSIDIIKDFIIHVHLADSDCKTWRKLPIGMGSIDFVAVARALEAIKFQGISIIELWYPEAEPDSSALISKRRLEAIGWRA